MFPFGRSTHLPSFFTLSLTYGLMRRQFVNQCSHLIERLLYVTENIARLIMRFYRNNSHYTDYSEQECSCSYFSLLPIPLSEAILRCICAALIFQSWAHIYIHFKWIILYYIEFFGAKGIQV